MSGVLMGRWRGKGDLLDIARWRGDTRLHGGESRSQRGGKLGKLLCLFLRGVHSAVATLSFLGGRGGVGGGLRGVKVSIGRGKSVSPILSEVMQSGFGLRGGRCYFKLKGGDCRARCSSFPFHLHLMLVHHLPPRSLGIICHRSILTMCSWTAESYYCGADPADWPRGKLRSKHGPSQVPLVIFIMVQFELHYQVGTGNNSQDSVQVSSGRCTAASLFSAC